MENVFKDNSHEYKEFLSYIDKYYATDSLLQLWQEIDRYRQLTDKKQRITKANDIYKTFITKGAKKEINTDDTLKATVKSDIKTGDVTIFDGILRSIFVYIETQVYPSFLKSDEFKQFQTKSTTNSRASLKSDYTSISEVESYTVKKKSVTSLIETLNKIIKILTEAIEYAEVEEFLRTIQEILNDLNFLIVCDFEDNKELRNVFINSVRDYLALLEQLKQTGRLERFVTSDRLRRKMEEINYNIFTEYDNYKKSLFLITAEPQNNETTKDVAYKRFYDTAVPQKASVIPEERLEVFADVDGKDFWNKSFGLNMFWVPWESFVESLELRIRMKIPIEELKILKYLLDSANLGKINQYKFSEFLKAFGPFVGENEQSNCIQTMKLILREKWFYGYISKNESEHLLTNTENGTFLLRFSKSRMGSFAMAFIHNKRVYHILINTCKPIGFKVYDNATKSDKTFRTLHEIVKQYAYCLKFPLKANIVYEKYFHGDMTAEESIETLQNKALGIFLVRFSSSELGGFVVSHKSINGTVQHYSIKKKEDKYCVETREGVLSFNSVQEIVDSLTHKGILTNAYLNPISDVVTIIEKWKKEIVDFESQIYDILSQPFKM